MRIEQRLLEASGQWRTPVTAPLADVQFVLVFGTRALLESPDAQAQLRRTYPGARLISASALSISGDQVHDELIAVTAIHLEKSQVSFATTDIADPADSHAAGCTLARQLTAPELVHVFVFADGQLVNGTELARGFNETLPAGVTLTGGLASDSTHFAKTLVGLDTPPEPGRIVALGLHGRHLRIGIGSSGGWVPFGPQRIVTRSRGNTLFELDGQSALRLYKHYLGEQAAALPASALRFPLSVTPNTTGQAVVRGSLGIDETTQSMRFAGDVPEGAQVRFLRASYEDLIDGAGRAAEQSALPDGTPELALCVSCVGRQVVLGQRTEEEVEHVRHILGPEVVLAGFYSNGELAPTASDPRCQLHNQTMSITTLREV